MNDSHCNARDVGWLSGFLLVLAIGSILAGALAIVGGSVFTSLLSLAIAVVFFALRRIIDQQEEVMGRLRKIESDLQNRTGKDA